MGSNRDGYNLPMLDTDALEQQANMRLASKLLTGGSMIGPLESPPSNNLFSDKQISAHGLL